MPEMSKAAKRGMKRKRMMSAKAPPKKAMMSDRQMQAEHKKHHGK